MVNLRLVSWTLLSILALAACRPVLPAGLPATPTGSSLSPPASSIPTTISAPPATPPAAPPTAAQLPTIAPGTSPAIPPVPTPAQPPAISGRDYPGPLYEDVFSIPVGEKGVAYQGLDQPGAQITGPNALAALSDGSFVIAELPGNRLLHYATSGERLGAIDLSALDILNVSDLATDSRDLYLLEISVNVDPERYRVNRLSLDGKLIASYDVPAGLHLENGLSGVAVDGEGRILLEVEDGRRAYPLAGPDGQYSPVSRGGYRFCGWQYLVEYPGAWAIPRLYADGVAVETHLSQRQGGLRFLYAWPDCSFYIVREDVVSDQPTIRTDQTVHYLSAGGQQVAVARYPLDEGLYVVKRNLVVGPDGAIYALLPRRETLDVVRLVFYKTLPPLVPEAAAPLVVSVP
jgi:hypothetical protein